MKYTIDMKDTGDFYIVEIDGYSPMPFIYNCLLDIAQMEGVLLPKYIIPSESYLLALLNSKGIIVDLGDW